MSAETVLAELNARRARTDAVLAKLSPADRQKLADYEAQEVVRLSAFEARIKENMKRSTESPPDLVDFAEGFEAGYTARSEHRAVLGSPSYRLGHAEGVQQAIEQRRLVAALRAKFEPAPVRSTRLLRGILIGFVLGLLLGWGFVKSARADTLADWRMLNEMCQGAAGAVSDKACQQRPRAASQLRREGWFQGEHGVWVSPEHVATFTRIVRQYDAAARENTGMLDTVMQAMMEDLRRLVPAEAIFALWNGRAGDLLAHTPYAAAMLMHGLPHLERRLSGRNDPRFRMVLRP